MSFGVYQIRNLRDGKRYIGSAAGCTITKRWSIHRGQLRHRTHINPHLQRAWNRDGESSFAFEVLQQCEPQDCVEREQHFIDQAEFSQLYNINPRAESRLGAKHTAAAKRKMSVAKQGRVSAFRGKRHTQESKTAMSTAVRGRYTGEKHPRAKLTERDVQIIKRALKRGIKQVRLAERFKVKKVTIEAIRQGRTWTHVS